MFLKNPMNSHPFRPLDIPFYLVLGSSLWKYLVYKTTIVEGAKIEYLTKQLLEDGKLEFSASHYGFLVLIVPKRKQQDGGYALIIENLTK